MSHSYKVEATALGGRGGRDRRVATSDGRHRFRLTEPEAGWVNSSGASSEQLLASAYAACLRSALETAAAARDVSVPIDANVTVRVSLKHLDAESDELDLDFQVAVDLPGLPLDLVEAIVGSAHDCSPFTRALRRITPVRTSCS